MQIKKVLLILVAIITMTINIKPAFALDDGAYLIGRSTSYVNPLTGNTEDGGTNITWNDMEKYCRLDIVKHLYHLGHEIDDMHVLGAYKTKLEMAGYPKELKDPWETRDYYLKKYGKET